MDGLTRVLLPVADGRPTVVLAGLDQVELVTAAWPHLCHPQPFLRVERGAEHVAMTERPDLGTSALSPNERVTLRYAAVRFDAHDLTEVTRQISRLHAAFRDRALAERHEQQTAARVLRGVERRLHAKDHPRLLELG